MFMSDFLFSEDFANALVREDRAVFADEFRAVLAMATAPDSASHVAFETYEKLVRGDSKP
jgi:hypothetical protein